MPKPTAFDFFTRASQKGLFAVSAFLLRLVVGFMFLDAAWAKLMVPNWSASGFLQNATGPFASWFQSLAQVSWVSPLNMYGLLFIGLGVLFGCLIRYASFFGAILMVLYYFAGFAANTAHGYIDVHVILFCVFLVFMVGGFGQVYGFDGYLAKQPFIQKHKWLKQWFV